jgi:Uma2 family endonuclease
MSLPARVRRPATYEDLLAVPDPLVAEILDGDLHTSPRPAVPHSVATSSLGGELYGPFDRGRGGPGGWWILVEPEIHLGPDVIVPDLVGWRRTRLPEMPRGPFLEIAPDWVCETISPSTERIDRGRKLAIYARERVGHVWLLNPIAETLEVYRLEQGRWLLLATFAGDVTARAEPFDAVELELWRLWGRSEPGRSLV